MNTRIYSTDLYRYMAKVFSAFEGREYEYYKVYLTDQVGFGTKKYCYHLLLTKNVKNMNIELKTIQDLNLIKQYSGDDEVIVLSLKDRQVLNLLDDNLNINADEYILSKYPYLQFVLLDLANILVENYGSVSYTKLARDINNTYNDQIIERKKQIEENQKSKLAEMRKNDEEIKKLIKYVESLNLPEGDKLSIKYNLEKRIKIRRPNNA